VSSQLPPTFGAAGTVVDVVCNLKQSQAKCSVFTPCDLSDNQNMTIPLEIVKKQGELSEYWVISYLQ
jgi:hypothetical protein